MYISYIFCISQQFLLVFVLQGRKVEANRQATIRSQDESSADSGNNLSEALEEKENEMKARESKLKEEIEVLKKKV